MTDVLPSGSANSASFVGKNCPYCQFPIKEAETAVACSMCGIPHHAECWQENGGCTTFGCSGASAGENAARGPVLAGGSGWDAGNQWVNVRAPTMAPPPPAGFACRQCGLQLGAAASFCPSCGMPAHADVPRVMPGAYVTNVPSHLGWAVAATLLCCLPSGIVAVVYASRVNSKLQIGDYEGAVRVSNLARTWCIVSAVLFVLEFIVVISAQS